MASFSLSPSGVLDPSSQLMGKYYVVRLKYHQDPNLADNNKFNFDSMVAVIHKGNSMMELKDLQYIVTKCNRGGIRTPLVLGKAMSDHSTCTWGDCLRQLDDLVAGGTTFTFPKFNPCPGITPVIFRDRPLSFVQFGLLAYQVGRCFDPEGQTLLNSFLETTDPAYIVGTTSEAYYAPPTYEPLQFFGQVPASSSPPSNTSTATPAILPPALVSSSSAMESTSVVPPLSYSDAARGAGIILAQTSQPPPSTLAMVSPPVSTPSSAPTTTASSTLPSEVPLSVSSSASPVTSSSDSSQTNSHVLDGSLAHIPGLDTEILGDVVEVQDMNYGIEIATLAKEVESNPQNQQKVLLLVDKLRLSMGVKDSIISNLHAVNDELCTKLQVAETLTKVYTAQLNPLKSAVNNLTDSVEQLQVNLCSALDEVLDDSLTRYTSVTEKLNSIQNCINLPSSTSPTVPISGISPSVQSSPPTSTMQSGVSGVQNSPPAPPVQNLPPASFAQNFPSPMHNLPPPYPALNFPPPSPAQNSNLPFAAAQYLPPPSPIQNLPPAMNFPPPPSVQPSVMASEVVPEVSPVVQPSSPMQPPPLMLPPPPVQPGGLVSQSGPGVAYQHHASYLASTPQHIPPFPQQAPMFSTPPTSRVLSLEPTFSQTAPLSSTLPLNYSQVPDSPATHYSSQGNYYQAPAPTFPQVHVNPGPPRVSKRPRSPSSSPYPPSAHHAFPQPSFPQSFASPPPPVYRPQHATSSPPPVYGPGLAPVGRAPVFGSTDIRERKNPAPRPSYPRRSDLGGGNGY